MEGSTTAVCVAGGDTSRVSNTANPQGPMLLPVGAWGTQFAAIPLMFLSTNYYQVVANTDNTVVSVGSTQIASLNAGEYRRFQSGAALITSNYPVQRVQIGQVSK